LALACLLGVGHGIQIAPDSMKSYPVEGVCGTWKLGIAANLPSCRSVATGGGALHYESLINNDLHLGPNVQALSDTFEFDVVQNLMAPVKQYPSFRHTSTYWSDPPCFTRKKFCARWDAAKETCPAEYRKDCPAYQNRPGCGGPKAGFSGGKKNSGGAYCVGIECELGGCPDEEFYPGCGALPVSKQAGKAGGGERQMVIEMVGTYENIFDKHADALAYQTCEVMCPCKKVAAVGSCLWMANPYIPGLSCTESDYRAYVSCLGCVSKNDTSSPMTATRGPCDLNNPTPLAKENPNVAFSDPMSEFFATPYTSGATGPSYHKRSTPIRFHVVNTLVTPTSDEQTAYLNANCNACPDWKKNVRQDMESCEANPQIRGGVNGTCKYLAATGLFGVKEKDWGINSGLLDLNCGKEKTGRCLYAQVYRHQEIFMYVSKVQSTYAQMLRSPIYGDGIYKLINTAPGCDAVDGASGGGGGGGTIGNIDTGKASTSSDSEDTGR